MATKKKITFQAIGGGVWRCKRGNTRLGVIERPFQRGDWCYVPLGTIALTASELHTISAFLEERNNELSGSEQ